MSQTNRIEPIYRKIKALEMDLMPERKLRVVVSHDDPRHRMSLTAIFSIPGLVIEAVDCKMTQYPHEECLLAEPVLQKMVGMQIEQGIFKRMKKIEAGRGCTHLNDLFHEACYTVIQGIGIYRRRQIEKLFPDFDPIQRLKVMLMIRPEWLEACVVFNADSKLMCSVEKARLPLEGDALKDLLEKL